MKSHHCHAGQPDHNDDDDNGDGDGIGDDNDDGDVDDDDKNLNWTTDVKIIKPIGHKILSGTHINIGMSCPGLFKEKTSNFEKKLTVLAYYMSGALRLITELSENCL